MPCPAQLCVGSLWVGVSLWILPLCYLTFQEQSTNRGFITFSNNVRSVFSVYQSCLRPLWETLCVLQFCILTLITLQILTNWFFFYYKWCKIHSFFCITLRVTSVFVSLGATPILIFTLTTLEQTLLLTNICPVSCLTTCTLTTLEQLTLLTIPGFQR